MTDKEKVDLRKNILLEEYEAGQELGLCTAKLRGTQNDFKNLDETVSQLIMYLNFSKMDPKGIVGARAAVTAMKSVLQTYGLTQVEEFCEEILAAQDRVLRNFQQKREAGMCAENPNP